MNDIEAALGLNQISKLRDFIAKRNIIARFYNNKLDKLKLILPKKDKNIINSYHLYPIRVQSKNCAKLRLKLFNFLRKKKILVNIHYIPVIDHPYFKNHRKLLRRFLNYELKTGNPIAAVVIKAPAKIKKGRKG